MSDQRYNLRGVSASKEDVHNAIKNIDKGIFPKAFCKIIPDILGATRLIAISCMPTGPGPNRLWHICIGERRATFRYGKALRKMRSL